MILRKILIVDDSAVVHHMFGLFLARYHGATLMSAENGAVALEVLARESSVDLILLDINMPVMNGFELLAALKQNPAYCAIPIIVITTQGRESDEERGLAMGASAFLRKPFKTAELYAVIEKVTKAGEEPA